MVRKYKYKFKYVFIYVFIQLVYVQFKHLKLYIFGFWHFAYTSLRRRDGQCVVVLGNFDCWHIDCCWVIYSCKCLWRCNPLPRNLIWRCNTPSRKSQTLCSVLTLTESMNSQFVHLPLDLEARLLHLYSQDLYVAFRGKTICLCDVTYTNKSRRCHFCLK